MKKLLITLILTFGLNSVAQAPCFRITKLYVRITAYSPKEIGEKSINHKGKSIKDERGIAVPKGFIPDNTMVRLPNGQTRIVNDRMPKKGNKIDVRYFQTLKSKSKTRAVSKELCKLDMGKDWIEILYSD